MGWLKYERDGVGREGGDPAQTCVISSTGLSIAKWVIRQSKRNKKMLAWHVRRKHTNAGGK